jgi:WhiB family redox-sensing transcriptional regulator
MVLAEWHRQAACRGQGPDAFVRGPKSDYRATRELCETCPVRRACLDFALADETLTGLWGGTTNIERRLIRRRRTVA